MRGNTVIMPRLVLLSKPFQNQPIFPIDKSKEGKSLHGPQKGCPSTSFIPKSGKDIPQAHPYKPIPRIRGNHAG